MKYAEKSQKPSKALLKMLGKAWKQSDQGVLKRLDQGKKQGNPSGLCYRWNEKHIVSRAKR